MRKIEEPQMNLGEEDISRIQFDLRSRDEIPKLLIGLQYIYCTRSIREAVFKILEEITPKEVDTKNGRPGMTLWKILVLGILRLNCNFDFDKVHEIANQHKTLRRMLGHGFLDDDKEYAIQTIKDNVQLLTPEILDRINEIVVKEGHKLILGKKKEKIKGSCDSFVVETDVHYPTDINLLFDAMRKLIECMVFFCEKQGFSDWRQSKHKLKMIKRSFRKCQNIRHAHSKNPEKKAEGKKRVEEAHEEYLGLAKEFLIKARQTMEKEPVIAISMSELLTLRIEIEKYIQHAERQIDQIRRRVIEGKVIPHEEKVFSIFEEHTEWIVKGKAGIRQELGHLVAVVKDQFNLILNHRVMEKEKDVEIAVSFISETKKRYPDLVSCSFDRGFYSLENKEKLGQILDQVTLSKRGKLSFAEKELEASEIFLEAKRKHSAVESSISALENHGLDRCLDYGISGYKRYVSLAVLARNIQIVGHWIQKKRLKKRRKEKWKQAA